jgi:hypothetical protein
MLHRPIRSKIVLIRQLASSLKTLSTLCGTDMNTASNRNSALKALETDPNQMDAHVRAAKDSIHKINILLESIIQTAQPRS